MLSGWSGDLEHGPSMKTVKLGRGTSKTVQFEVGPAGAGILNTAGLEDAYLSNGIGSNS